MKWFARPWVTLIDAGPSNFVAYMSYSMSDLLQLVVSEGSSDLHIRVGVPPVIRVHGTLHRVEGPPLRPEDTEELMRSITSEDHIQHVREAGRGGLRVCLRRDGPLPCQRLQGEGELRVGLAPDSEQAPDPGTDRHAAAHDHELCCTSRAAWCWSPARPAPARRPLWPR